MTKIELIKKIENLRDPEIKDVLLGILEEAEKKEDSITRREFLEFVNSTNENFKKVWEAIHELTEAQKLTEKRVNELAEAQKRTEERLEQLTRRVDELAEAQKRTEERLNELAEAQKRTEERLDQLIEDHKETRRQLGGLSHAFGYLLEDRAFKGLPRILKDRFSIELTQSLKRTYIKMDENKYFEVNIFGKGIRDGKGIYIIGECKSQLGKRDADRFLKMVKKLEEKLEGDKFLVIVTYQVPPHVMEYVEKKGLNIVLSYELSS